jgi:hypothetical protein
MGRTFGVQTPPEPAPGSVVLDNAKRAWQRGNGWRCVEGPVTGSASSNWARLLVQYGPLTLVHDGAADPHAPSSEIMAAAESERETWRTARRELAGVLGADLDATWPTLLEIVRNDAAVARAEKETW